MRKKNKTIIKRAAAIFLILAFSAGCATPPEKVSATYVSPVQYQGYNCNQIQQEIARVEKKIDEVSGQQKKEADKDGAAMAIGMILFWPALFFLAGQDKKDELARLKGEYEALERISIEKQCSFASNMQQARTQSQQRRLATTTKEERDINTPDERFLLADNKKIVVDTENDLEWVAGPDTDMTYEEAKSWVENLYIAGRGWRMPTLDELKGLYQKGVGTRNMTSLLKTTGWYVWGEETSHVGLYAWSFDFKNNCENRSSTNDSYQVRVFAVRPIRKLPALFITEEI